MSTPRRRRECRFRCSRSRTPKYRGSLPGWSKPPKKRSSMRCAWRPPPPAPTTASAHAIPLDRLTDVMAKYNRLIRMQTIEMVCRRSALRPTRSARHLSWNGKSRALEALDHRVARQPGSARPCRVPPPSSPTLPARPRRESGTARPGNPIRSTNRSCQTTVSYSGPSSNIVGQVTFAYQPLSDRPSRRA